MSEVVPSGVEEQREEEEDEEEIPPFRPRGLRSRGPMILEEGELADEPATTEAVSYTHLTLPTIYSV